MLLIIIFIIIRPTFAMPDIITVIKSFAVVKYGGMTKYGFAFIIKPQFIRQYQAYNSTRPQ